ncbi:MAG: 3-oxoadipate enol-lactonase [Trueperaceae bacterium]
MTAPTAMRGTSRFVDVAGVTLHAREDGALAPTGALGKAQTRGSTSASTFVYLNSLGSDLRIWDGVVARVPEHAHLRFDQRGHGLSDAPSGPYSITALALDALGLIARTGLERAVLVGVSVGGMIAMRAALERPDLVAGLVLCDTAAKIGDDASWTARIASVRDRGLADMADEVLQRWFPPAFRSGRPADYRGYRNMLARTPVEGYVGTCAALRDEDLRDRVARLTMPSLVLGGSEDGSTPPETVVAFAGTLPGARFELVEGAGHLPSIDAPDVVADHLRAFLSEVESA